MKKIILIFSAVLVLFSSCKKSFLELSPYDQIPSNEAITDESSMQTAVYGLYAQLRSANLWGRSVPLYADVMSDNAFISTTNSNRYLAEYNFTFISTNANSSATWASAYTAILRANNIINSTVAVTPTSSQLRGEALTVRALMYFYLVRSFGDVPLKIKSTSSDQDIEQIPKTSKDSVRVQS